MSDDIIKCEKNDEDCPCEDCTDKDVPMAEEGPVNNTELPNADDRTFEKSHIPEPEESRIITPGQDPRTAGLEAKVRAQKCWEAIKIVCQQFDCEIEGVAILKNGSVQTAIACNPVKRLTEEQEAAVKAAQAVGGVPQ